MQETMPAAFAASIVSLRPTSIRGRLSGPARFRASALLPRFTETQPHAGFAFLHASASGGGGSFLKTVLYDSSTFDCTTGSDCTPIHAGGVCPISAFIIAMASATPWSYGR